MDARGIRRVAIHPTCGASALATSSLPSYPDRMSTFAWRSRLDEYICMAQSLFNKGVIDDELWMWVCRLAAPNARPIFATHGERGAPLFIVYHHPSKDTAGITLVGHPTTLDGNPTTLVESPTTLVGSPTTLVGSPTKHGVLRGR